MGSRQGSIGIRLILLCGTTDDGSRRIGQIQLAPHQSSFRFRRPDQSIVKDPNVTMRCHVLHAHGVSEQCIPECG
jgi:hypothetical protein